MLLGRFVDVVVDQGCSADDKADKRSTAQDEVLGATRISGEYTDCFEDQKNQGSANRVGSGARLRLGQRASAPSQQIGYRTSSVLQC
jgi:hypothetical protein